MTNILLYIVHTAGGRIASDMLKNFASECIPNNTSITEKENWPLYALFSIPTNSTGYTALQKISIENCLYTVTMETTDDTCEI